MDVESNGGQEECDQLLGTDKGYSPPPAVASCTPTYLVLDIGIRRELGPLESESPRLIPQARLDHEHGDRSGWREGMWAGRIR